MHKAIDCWTADRVRALFVRAYQLRPHLTERTGWTEGFEGEHTPFAIKIVGLSAYILGQKSDERVALMRWAKAKAANDRAESFSELSRAWGIPKRTLLDRVDRAAEELARRFNRVGIRETTGA